MVAWIRGTLLACAAALGASVACGGADQYSPIPKVPCAKQYYRAEDVLPDPPDGAALCPKGGVCNYQTQAGCGAGKTCAPHLDKDTLTLAPACRDAGQRAKGEACDNSKPDPTKLCGPGMDCADGHCHTFCCGGDWSACGAGESCIHQAFVKIGDGGLLDTVQYSGADLCFAVGTCDVLDLQACKSEGKTCRIADPVAHVACMPPSDLVAGDPCDHDKQCGPGLQCVEDTSGLSSDQTPPGTLCTGTLPCTCRHLCRWGLCADEACPFNDGVCVRFNRDPPGVGECTPHWHGPSIPPDGGVLSDAATSVGGGGP
jgi:hypothetical protein